MGDELLNIFQAVGIVLTLVFGLVAAVKGLREYSRSNSIRREELLWKKSLFAREVWAGHRSGKPRDAMMMLDWNGRKFDLGSGDPKAVWWDTMMRALRKPAPAGEDFSASEVHIRDCFDKLFEDYSEFEFLIANSLLDPDPIRTSCGYYIKKIIEHDNRWFQKNGSRPIENFMTAYGYRRALDFCARRSSWRKRADLLPSDKQTETEPARLPPAN